MSQQPSEVRRIVWSEALPFSHLFRGFGLATDFNKIALAAVAVLAIYLGGRILDGAWQLNGDGKHLAVVGADGINEFNIYHTSRFNRETTLDWLHQVGKKPESKRVGVFTLFMSQARGVVYELTSAAIGLDPGRVVRATMKAVALKAWMFNLHPIFAILFTFLVVLPAWAYFGAAICRIAALQATRGEPISIGQALGFARDKFFTFYIIPIVPLAGLVLIKVAFGVAGLVGAIPLVGTILVPLFWFVAIGAGIVMGLLLIGAVLCGPLTYPALAVESTDAFEGWSRTLSYVHYIWRTVLYYGLALVYGAICFSFVKLAARVGLVLVGMFVSPGMNVGDASGPKGDVADKLKVMWQAPTLDFSTPFYGQVGNVPLTGASTIGRFLIAGWTFLLVAAVAGWLISYFFSSSTLIYLLLRRDADQVDLEEVYLDDDALDDQVAPATPEPAASAAPASIASLPVVGQSAPGGDGH